MYTTSLSVLSKKLNSKDNLMTLVLDTQVYGIIDSYESRLQKIHPIQRRHKSDAVVSGP